MTVSMPIARRTTKCLVPGASAIYLFNEGAGQVLTDYSGNGNHGTLGSTAGDDTNDPTWTGQGASFIADDTINLGRFRATSSDGAALTIAICTTNNNFTSESGLISQYVGGGNKRGWGISTNSGVFRLSVSDNGTADAGHVWLVGGGSVPNGVPILYLVVFEAGTVSLYVNGVDVATNTQLGGPILTINFPDTPVLLGSYNGGTAGDRAIHSVVVYPRALGPAEVAQTYAYLKGYLATRGVVLA